MSKSFKKSKSDLKSKFDQKSIKVEKEFLKLEVEKLDIEKISKVNNGFQEGLAKSGFSKSAQKSIKIKREPVHLLNNSVTEKNAKINKDFQKDFIKPKKSIKIENEPDNSGSEKIPKVTGDFQEGFSKSFKRLQESYKKFESNDVNNEKLASPNEILTVQEDITVEGPIKMKPTPEEINRVKKVLDFETEPKKELDFETESKQALDFETVEEPIEIKPNTEEINKVKKVLDFETEPLKKVKRALDFKTEPDFGTEPEFGTMPVLENEPLNKVKKVLDFETEPDFGTMPNLDSEPNLKNEPNLENEPLRITYNECVLCSKKYRSSLDIQTHLKSFHNVDKNVQSQFVKQGCFEVY